jgi:hypothetical protein
MNPARSEARKRDGKGDVLGLPESAHGNGARKRLDQPLTAFLVGRHRLERPWSPKRDFSAPTTRKATRVVTALHANAFSLYISGRREVVDDDQGQEPDGHERD